jgi:ankyrin repeat protein
LITRFRWVACQLDHLCDLPNDAARRKALSTLPPTLNETYERILLRINQSDLSIQRLVQRTLYWIYGNSGYLTSAGLCEALSIEEGQTTLDEDSTYDEEVVLLHCSSFIRKSVFEDRLEFAHFTVEEYLVSLESSPNPLLAQYTLKEDIMNPVLARTCLTYLLCDNFSQFIPKRISDLVQQKATRPFRQEAVFSWISLAGDHWDDPSLLDLAADLFDRSKIQNLISWTRDHMLLGLCDTVGGYDESIEKFGESITKEVCGAGLSPLHIAAGHLLGNLCRKIITPDWEINEISSFGTPLHCALSWSRTLQSQFQILESIVRESRLREDVVQLLLARGGDPRIPWRGSRGGPLVSCLELCVEHAGHDFRYYNEKVAETMVALLANGAPLYQETFNRLETFWTRTSSGSEFKQTLIKGIEALESDEEIERNIPSLRIMLRLDERSTATSHTAISELALDELMAKCVQAIRFDTKSTLEKLFRDPRVDFNTEFEVEEADYQNPTWRSGQDNLYGEYAIPPPPPLLGNSSTVLFKGTALHLASMYGSINVVELLLSAGANINATNDNGWTPLHMAASYLARQYDKKSRCMILLLERGANVNLVDSNGRNVWHKVALYNNMRAVKVLKPFTGDLESALLELDHEGFIPLFLAAHSNAKLVFSELLLITTAIPAMCPNGLTLAHYVAKFENVADLALIQNRGYSLNCKSRDGKIPLNFLNPTTPIAVVRAFLDAGADATIPNADGLSPLHVLLQDWKVYDQEVLDLFLTHNTTQECVTARNPLIHFATGLTRSPPDQTTSTYYSTTGTNESRFHPPNHSSYYQHRNWYSGRVERVQRLIEKEVNINAKDSSGRACLQLLLEKVTAIDGVAFEHEEHLNSLLVYLFEKTGDLEILQTPFLWRGIPTLPIVWLISKHHESTVKICLKRGVNVTLRPSGPVSKLQSLHSAIEAACFYGCSSELFDELIDNFDTNCDPAVYEYTLAHTACSKNSMSDAEILSKLRDHGFNIDLKSHAYSQNTPLLLAAENGKINHIRKLLELGARPHARNVNGWEALHYATAYGHTSVFEQFPELAIDPDHRVGVSGKIDNQSLSSTGCNILHMAAFCGESEIVEFLLKDASGEDLETLNDEGVSPLYIAARSRGLETVKVLLLAGVNVDTDFGADRGRAIHAAAMANDTAIAQLLLDHGASLLPNSTQITPYDTAIFYGNIDFADWLQHKDAENCEFTPGR